MSLLDEEKEFKSKSPEEQRWSTHVEVQGVRAQTRFTQHLVVACALGGLLLQFYQNTELKKEIRDIKKNTNVVAPTPSKSTSDTLKIK